MKEETKRFPLRVLLTVTTGRLLTNGKGDRDNGIGDLYEILGWMTNDSPFTHQLGRFAEECLPWLNLWFPELQKANEFKWIARLDELIECAKKGSGTIAESIDLWLKWIQEPGELGLKAEYDVPRIAKGDHVPKDPVAELIELRESKEGIIVI